MEAFRFPDGFRLGVATAATQIDGGCQNGNWYDWYRQGKIKDGSSPDVATRHREHLDEDTAMLVFLGVRDYRMGLEWARLEPEDGVFCDEAFAEVRAELQLLLRQGVRPLLTIHHFSNPLWFERMGGFLHPQSVRIFLRFVDEATRRLGDLVEEYITINEPNVYATNGYFFGAWPPGRRSILKTWRIIRRMGECHRRAYLHIHRVRREMGLTGTRIGFAHHMRPFVPLDPKNPWHRFCACVEKKIFQDYITRTYTIGTRRHHGVYADFHAVNYYSRSAVAGLGDGTLPGVPRNDLGWEIYPEGLLACVREQLAVLALPVYVTENGTADTHDAFRARFLYDQLKLISESGLPILRYYHWCFVDNWEWVEGFTARFGLVALDLETMARTVKESGFFYRDMIASGGVTEAAIEQYCKGQTYHT